MQSQSRKSALPCRNLRPDIEPRICALSGDIPKRRREGLPAAIGHEVRNWRLKRGWKLEELARAASLSMGAVSRIENGTVSPSLTTLRTLSWALGVPISLLLRRFEQKYEAAFTKAVQPVELRSHPASAEALGDIEVLSSGIKVEPRLVRLVEQAARFPTFQHSGMKFLYMLEGAIRYSHGEDHYDLRPGDSLLLEASVLHGPKELLRGPALYLSIASARS